ncbi:hypothetical protein LG3211_4043 [Lysobacter gummosus]|nr:hypothetical protein LG3211_4043 [Lysobacter gummosus]
MYPGQEPADARGGRIVADRGGPSKTRSQPARPQDPACTGFVTADASAGRLRPGSGRAGAARGRRLPAGRGWPQARSGKVAPAPRDGPGSGRRTSRMRPGSGHAGSERSAALY